MERWRFTGPVILLNPGPVLLGSPSIMVPVSSLVGRGFRWGAENKTDIRTISRCSITLTPTRVNQSKRDRLRMSRLQAWARLVCSPRVRLDYLRGEGIGAPAKS